MLGEKVEDNVRNGWSREDAEVVTLLPNVAGLSLRRALTEGRADLAASCHALSRALASRGEASGEVAPPLYAALRGATGGRVAIPGLVDDEPRFAQLLEGDATGFRGLTAMSALTLTANPDALREDGCYTFDATLEDGEGGWIYQPGDVMCIASQANDAAGYHSAVLIAYDPPTYVLPPNTLLELVKVEGPPFTARQRRWYPWYTTPKGNRITVDNLTGELYLDRGDHFEDQHGQRVECAYDASALIETEVNQRLLTCTATYVRPGGGGTARGRPPPPRGEPAPGIVPGSPRRLPAPHPAPTVDDPAPLLPPGSPRRLPSPQEASLQAEPRQRDAFKEQQAATRWWE